MTTRINVIDLDKTLIPYDSFRILVLGEIKRLNLRIGFFTFLRILRLHNQGSYKMKVTEYLQKNVDDHEVIQFVGKLHRDIDTRVLKEVSSCTDDDSINILLSASPDFYVSKLIEELGWMGKGSYFNANGQFFHLYGANKIKWLVENYPRSKYLYNLAISDSSTDDELLNMFKKKIKWTLP